MESQHNASDEKKKALEIEKLQKEIRALDKPFRWSPAMLPALLSCIAAMGLLLSGSLSGWFSNQNSLIELRNERLRKTQDSLEGKTLAARRFFDSSMNSMNSRLAHTATFYDSAHHMIAKLQSDKLQLANEILSDNRVRELSENALKTITEYYLRSRKNDVSPLTVHGIVVHKETMLPVKNFKLSDYEDGSAYTYTDSMGMYRITLKYQATEDIFSNDPHFGIAFARSDGGLFIHALNRSSYNDKLGHKIELE